LENSGLTFYCFFFPFELHQPPRKRCQSGTTSLRLLEPNRLLRGRTTRTTKPITTMDTGAAGKEARYDIWKGNKCINMCFFYFLFRSHPNNEQWESSNVDRNREPIRFGSNLDDDEPLGKNTFISEHTFLVFTAEGVSLIQSSSCSTSPQPCNSTPGWRPHTSTANQTLRHHILPGRRRAIDYK